MWTTSPAHSKTLCFPCQVLLPQFPVMPTVVSLETRNRGKLGGPFVDDLGDVFTVQLVLLPTVEHKHAFLAHITITDNLYNEQI